VPIPIQSASITERLRKFFRIRGKTAFALDEIVAPVVLVQDLTKGPYQAGVTPAAGQNPVVFPLTGTWAMAILLNDKPGSITPVLPNQFDNRTFSFTWAEIANIDAAGADLLDLQLLITSRAAVVAVGAVPVSATNLFSIQNNDGSVTVPVEMIQVTLPATGSLIWGGLLGDNTNTLGSRRTFDDIQPNITIGPDDALVFTTPFVPTAIGSLNCSVRGFYQEQPA